ncbi:MAG: AAA family ATPase [Saprospiraceae bacterium]|nr:AAA family ATPase [Saprospiraceae bacterium]
MNKQIHEHVKNLREALQLEKQEDLEQYKARIEQLPLSERREQGYTWHPVVVQKSGFTYGDRAFVIVERTNQLNQRHQFRSGSMVSFYTRQSGAQQAEITGVVNFADRNRMKIILNSRELPDWMNLGNVGVDLLFDERTYQEMEKALRILESLKQGRSADLAKILINMNLPEFQVNSVPVTIVDLNESQNAAVNQILDAEEVCIIHGPPGTGKTTTLVQAVKILASRENTILVCAPSNTAVDLLTERIAEKGLSVVRIGHISRVDENIIKHTLEAQLANHPENKNLKKVKIQANEYRKQAKKFRRKFGEEERSERRDLYKLASDLTAWAKQLEERMIDQLLSGAQVITATLVGSAHPVLNKREFRTLVIDEAAQALEPATWIPILKASKVVLAGDPYQLPPTVKSLAAARAGLDKTLIERCIASWGNVSLLRVQYRMHQAIMEFSNRQFYDGALLAANQVKSHLIPGWLESPVVFLDTAGTGFEEKFNPEDKSRSNPEELHLMLEHLYQLKEIFSESENPSIALISPYRQQVNLMEEVVREDSRLEGLDTVVKTIDGFQGQERDIVYISLVRSNDKGEIGFLKDIRRMNVAMTRARKLLVVVGDSATISSHPFYQAFLDYVDEAGKYQTGWEYMR